MSASSGFTALRELDFNGDDAIDAFDPQWHNLQVWQDKNSDGFSQAAKRGAAQRRSACGRFF